MSYTLMKFLGWAVLFAVVGGLIGWSLRSLKSRGELAGVRAQVIDEFGVEWMQQRLVRHDEVLAERDVLRSRLGEMEKAEQLRTADVPGGARDVAPSGDLTLIKGIGPKIAELCNEIGILDWHDLARAELSDLEAMLEAAGPRYKFHDPRTWTEQADLLAQGRWDEFNELLTELDHRR